MLLEVAAARPLLVVARDELADEAERDELDADDDEQHAERQQRAVADRLPGQLQHGQVDEQRASRRRRAAGRRRRRDAAAGAGSGP